MARENMAIKYNIEKLKNTISALCKLTGLSMLVLDTKLNCIFSYHDSADLYCGAIIATQKGKYLCYCCDREMIKRAGESMLPVSHICHAGLCDSVVPIIKNGIISGYIIVGRVRMEPKLGEELLERLCEYGIEKEALAEYYEQTTLLTEEQLTALVSLISDILFENAIEIEYNDFITRASDYIENNLSSDLSVSRLTEALYVSKNFLYRSFRSYYDKTVNDYVSEQRIKRAEKMLTETDASVNEIAEAVGIESYSYFSKLFKQRRGVSPQKYRAQNKKQ